MSPRGEWLYVIGVTFYDVVVEPVWRRVKRGWELGRAGH